MQKGDKLVIVRDVDPPPGKFSSPNSVLVAALVALGIELDLQHPPEETRERVPDGKGGFRTRRTVIWTLAARSACGRYSTAAMVNAWNSAAWIEANPEHPLAYLKMGFENHTRLVDYVHAKAPVAIHRRGRRIALIPMDATPERRAQLLADLNK